MIRRVVGAAVLAASVLATSASAAPSPLAQQQAAVQKAVGLTSVTAAQLRGITLDSFDEPIHLPVFAPCNHKTGDCTWTNHTTGKTVVILGDSHAYQWSPAIELALEPHHVKVVLWWLPGCPAANVQVLNTLSNTSAVNTVCTSWRTATWTKIDRAKPSYVILSERTYQTFASPNHIVSNAVWQQGLETTIRHFQHDGARVIVIGDLPAHQNFASPVQCLAAHPSRIQLCATPTSGLPAAWQARPGVEAAAARATGASFINPTSWVCARGICPAVIGGVRVYMDWSHLRAHYTESLTPVMAQVLLPVMGFKP